MSNVGNIVKGITNFLAPEGETERLVFRKFDGAALAKAAENGTDVKSSAVTTIVLQINPQNISYSEPKITQKVQTSAPGSFVVFDWGTDLLAITIRGNTGNLLPGILTSGFNPMKGLIDDVVGKIDPEAAAKAQSSVKKLPGEYIDIAQNIMLNNMTYFEILELSPKYQTFKNLRRMYKVFDADFDVLTLEIGDVVHRGYFTDFPFDQTANEPWNWKYTIGFVSLAVLTDGERRGDEAFPVYDEIVSENE